jgi:hypothetical protein
MSRNFVSFSSSSSFAPISLPFVAFCRWATKLSTREFTWFSQRLRFFVSVKRRFPFFFSLFRKDYDMLGMDMGSQWLRMDVLQTAAEDGTNPHRIGRSSPMDPEVRDG